MTLYEALLSVVGPVPVSDGIGGLFLWLAGCLLTVIVSLYAIYYVTRIMIDWAR